MNLIEGAAASGAGILVNDDNISNSDGALTLAVADLINNGYITAFHDMDIKAAVSGSGEFRIAQNATLEFDNSASSGGTVLFEGGGELKLADATAFDETIAGFAGESTIDLADIVATSANWANNVLTMTESGGRNIDPEACRFLLGLSFYNRIGQVGWDAHSTRCAPRVFNSQQTPTMVERRPVQRRGTNEWRRRRSNDDSSGLSGSDA